MKKITLFKLKYCPYCVQAIKYMDDLIASNPAYATLDIEIVDEGEERKRAAQFDYYYVPTFYLGAVKVHEGAVTRQQVQTILTQALADDV